MSTKTQPVEDMRFQIVTCFALSEFNSIPNLKQQMTSIASCPSMLIKIQHKNKVHYVHHDCQGFTQRIDALHP